MFTTGAFNGVDRSMLAGGSAAVGLTGVCNVWPRTFDKAPFLQGFPASAQASLLEQHWCGV
jgi:hypothetical protein